MYVPKKVYKSAVCRLLHMGGSGTLQPVSGRQAEVEEQITHKGPLCAQSFLACDSDIFIFTVSLLTES